MYSVITLSDRSFVMCRLAELNKPSSPHWLIPILHITQPSVLYVSPAVAINDRLNKTEPMPFISNTVQQLTI